MTRNFSLTRLGQLTNTSYRLLRQEGLGAFTNRLGLWLRGERRYMRHDRPELHGYEAYCKATTPNEAELAAQRKEARVWQNAPSFGILTPVYQPPLYIFRRTVESVLAQSYPYWRWYLADSSSNDEIWEYLTYLAAQDARIVPIRLTQNKGISENSNAALRQALQEATCEYIALLDHDDKLAPEALYAMAKFIQAQPDADFIYSDGDKINAEDHRFDPIFKPNWSPEMLLCVNLLCQMAVMRRDLLAKVGMFDPSKDGAQDWDLFLRISEVTQKIYHLPKVLYHWRVWERSTASSREAKSYAAEAQLAAIREHLVRTGIQNPRVFFDSEHPIHGTYPLVIWEQPQPRSIAIIIPSRDHADMLLGCLATLFGRTRYPNYRVIVVDTGSTEQATFDLYARYAQEPRFQVVKYTEPFNFSKACNFGAQHAAESDLLLFLNNDIEVLDGTWLARMAQWYERTGVGIVGAKLIFPDGLVQHGGVYIGGGGLAAHLFSRLPENLITYFGNDGWYRNVLAVTGACLMISRQAFDAVGGFDEAYQLNYSDVALCLRAHEAGYRIVYTPHARLIHYESVTHKRRIPRVDFLRANEAFQKWIKSGDPYYNPSLSYAMPNHYVTMDPSHRALYVNRMLMARLPRKAMITLPDDLA
ncbi:MAG: glycosyltransferase family 2 protein [Chloroflexi bacterium CFX4]|nr:glycosyltransferase family 2 protein [Chloroflexi bacterium CFX4]MDL1921190.1 glycosyltransferase family 2 protein [Chloroflexi bacterium CFX3]